MFLGLLATPIAVNSSTIHSERCRHYNTGSKYKYTEHGWLFTREEIKTIYEKEYEEGERLKAHIRVEDGECIASQYGESFKISQKFVQNTLDHLEQMLEKGYAEYIFRLDAFHGHIFIPNEAFYGKYLDIYHGKLIKEYAGDEQLGILYHNAEHLALRIPPKTGEIDPKAKELISKRNVLGWYDGRPIELTYPKDPDEARGSNTAWVPDGYHTIGNINFKATKNGEFAIHPNGKEIRIDISFDAFDYF